MIKSIAMLIEAAKKHHTEITYSPKNNFAIIKDTKRMLPIIDIFFTLEIKAGITVELR